MADRLFIRNKGKDFRDRTNDAHIGGRDHRGKYIISFGPYSEPLYYNPENVAIISSENVPFEGTALFAKGVRQYYAIKLNRLSSQNPAFGTRFEIISKASSGRIYAKLYFPSEIEQKELASSSSLFRYLQSVAEAIKPDIEDVDKREYLPRQFKRLQILEGTPADRMAHPEKAAPSAFHPKQSSIRLDPTLVRWRPSRTPCLIN